MIPTAHTSTFSLQKSSSEQISGALQPKVPTYEVAVSTEMVAIPRSPTTQVRSCLRKMFLSLMSLWMAMREWSCCKPTRTSMSMRMRSWKGGSWWVRKQWRSDSGQQGMQMRRQSPSNQWWIQLTTLGWFIPIMKESYCLAQLFLTPLACITLHTKRQSPLRMSWMQLLRVASSQMMDYSYHSLKLIAYICYYKQPTSIPKNNSSLAPHAGYHSEQQYTAEITINQHSKKNNGKQKNVAVPSFAKNHRLQYGLRVKQVANRWIKQRIQANLIDNFRGRVCLYNHSRRKMGCQASDTYQPHKKPTQLALTLTSEPKQLYRGFCFGSKAIQVYLPNRNPTRHFSTIDELSNQSFSMNYPSKAMIDSPDCSQ